MEMKIRKLEYQLQYMFASGLPENEVPERYWSYLDPSEMKEEDIEILQDLWVRGMQYLQGLQEAQEGRKERKKERIEFH